MGHTDKLEPKDECYPATQAASVQTPTCATVHKSQAKESSEEAQEEGLLPQLHEPDYDPVKASNLGKHVTLAAFSCDFRCVRHSGSAQPWVIGRIQSTGIADGFKQLVDLFVRV